MGAKGKDFQEEGILWAKVWRRESVGCLQNSTSTINGQAPRPVNHRRKQSGQISGPWASCGAQTSFPDITRSRAGAGEGWRVN